MLRILYAFACLVATPGLLQANQVPSPSDAKTGSEKKADSSDFTFKFQSTFIDQHLFPFHSPYAGSNSLHSSNESELSQTYTIFVGKRFDPRFEAYVDPEDSRGAGLSNTLGLAGFANGEAIRIGVNVDPYLARYFVRYTAPLGPTVPIEHVDEDFNQVAGNRPTKRVVVSAGKMATSDFFDTNEYANSARTQFMNWAFINNLAYDYAADTRGYSMGLVIEFIEPSYAVRLGEMQMPTYANGPNLDADVTSAHGDQIELETHPQIAKKKPNAVWKLLAYHNQADMGDYRDAIALGQATDQSPSITATRHPGTAKYGFGTNFEQGLADPDDDSSKPWKTGVFFRAGWDDGTTESFAFTEADASLSAGVQLCGSHWRSRGDLLGVAISQESLSAAHRDYLADGGYGFQIGDGKLNYGQERVLETYYNHPFGTHVTLGGDIQFIQNPAYNQDRGPVAVASMRLHIEF